MKNVSGLLFEEILMEQIFKCLKEIDISDKI